MTTLRSCTYLPGPHEPHHWLDPGPRREVDGIPMVTLLEDMEPCLCPGRSAEDEDDVQEGLLDELAPPERFDRFIETLQTSPPAPAPTMTNLMDAIGRARAIPPPPQIKMRSEETFQRLGRLLKRSDQVHFGSPDSSLNQLLAIPVRYDEAMPEGFVAIVPHEGEAIVFDLREDGKSNGGG